MPNDQKVYMGLDQAIRFAELILRETDITIVRKSWKHLEASARQTKYDMIFNEPEGVWEFQHNGTKMASLAMYRHF